MGYLDDIQKQVMKTLAKQAADFITQHIGNTVFNTTTSTKVNTKDINNPPEIGCDYVYFIQAVQSKNIKIGYTSDVQKRINTLQTGNSEPLVFLGYIQGTQREEHELHRRFFKTRLRKDGEWFAPSPDLLEYINSNCIRLNSYPKSREIKLGELVNICSKCEHKRDILNMDYDDKLWCALCGKEVEVDDGCPKFSLSV